MPCYLDTIVKIKHVKQNETKDGKSISVWAIGVYPVGCEDYEMEMVLFVPRSFNERDPESQAIFKRGEYYSIGGKIIPNRYAGVIRPKMLVTSSTHLIINNNDSESNKCPLKVSFVGSPQGKISEIENTESSVIEMHMTDYIFGLDHNYIINTVFSHTNPRFEHLKSTINLQESIIFVVGQMEIINGTFYINAKDINYVSVKKENSVADSSQTPSASTNSTRSKLFNVYQNMTKNLKDAPTVQLPNSDNIESGPSVKRKRTEELYEHLPEMENANPTVDYEPEANEINSTKNIKPRKNQKILTRNQRKGKGRATQNVETSQNLDQEMRDSDEE